MSGRALDIARDRLDGGLVIEASAGTGKTYSVAAIVTRELALSEDLRIGQILITTFTRNAAAELRDRVRRRLASTIRMLRGELAAGDDPVVARIVADGETAAAVGRLARALVEFDSATISTIHGVCVRVLRAAGEEISSVVDADVTDRVVAEVVNDAVVGLAEDGPLWEEARLAVLVRAMLADPSSSCGTTRPTSTRRKQPASNRFGNCSWRVSPGCMQACPPRTPMPCCGGPGSWSATRVAPSCSRPSGDASGWRSWTRPKTPTPSSGDSSCGSFRVTMAGRW